MYSYIKGIITDITPTNIILENNKIGYEIVVANPYIYTLEEEITIYTSQQIREDSNTLYGFKTKEDKKVFLQLLKVKGVGPKSALAMLTGESSNNIILAIENSDVDYLTKFPGIGKKSAQQIILDLKGKINFVENIKKVKEENKLLKDAILTLEVLGYSKKELEKIEKKLINYDYTKVDEYIKTGLKLLSNI